MSWVGLAQSAAGEMMGSNMLVAYASQNDSSVTVSPRLGTGHTMPKYNKDAQVSLLDGSGIVNGSMVANIKCQSCYSWQGGSMALNDSSSGWIFAYTPADTSSAGAIRSDNVSTPISIHKGYDSFKVDLSKAIAANYDSNPFTGQILQTTSPSAASSLAKSGLQMHLATVKVAHGTVLGLAFGLVYPAGAILIRLHGKTNTWAIHAGIQVFAYAMSIAGMGMGIYLALAYHLLTSPHALIGFVVICLLFFMPFAGWIQHKRFCRHKQRTWWGRGHAYLGRSLMILGIINVGTGLMLSAPYGGEPVLKGEMAYGVLGGVVGLAWLSIVVVTAIARRRKRTQNGADAANGAASIGSDGSDGASESYSPVDAEKNSVRITSL